MAESVQYTLSYFNLPGRGEVIRNMFKYAKIEFTDERISFQDWKETVKPTTVWGSMPYLQVSGQDTPLTQTRAVARYVAKLAGLYPKDGIMACHADALFDVCEDIGVSVNDTGKGLEKEDKIAARQKLRDGYNSSNKGGDYMGLMGKLDDFLGRADFAGDYALGSEISMADFVVHQYMANITSGFYDGVDDKVLAPFANIQKVMAQMKPVLESFSVKYTLTYFDLPGRGQAIRDMFKLGKVSFVDQRISFDDWKAMKGTTVWGSLPYMTVAGRDTPLTQTRAITRYVAKLTGLYPTDDMMACHADAVFDAVEDMIMKVIDIGKGLEKPEQIAARKKVISEYDPKNKSGDFMGLLGKLDDFLGGKEFTGDWALGAKMTVADIVINQYIDNATGGMFAGMDRADILKNFGNVQKVITQVKPVLDGTL